MEREKGKRTTIEGAIKESVAEGAAVAFAFAARGEGLLLHAKHEATAWVARKVTNGFSRMSRPRR